MDNDGGSMPEIQARLNSVHPCCSASDWMAVSGEVHYARNRSSFSEYTPISAIASNIVPGLPSMRVIGIGTVRLQVLKRKGSDDANEIVLKGVMHIPTAVCNGFHAMNYMRESGNGLTLADDCWQGFSVARDGSHQREPVWYAEDVGLFDIGGLGRLKLAGIPQGESPVAGSPDTQDAAFSLSIILTEEERRVVDSLKEARVPGSY
ncbi:hypothetical protein HWV62_21234 [Athelia sp. TMB]|nr:hypothetical protein HWV62_21234 [Athelia sp. TMB]